MTKYMVLMHLTDKEIDAQCGSIQQIAKSLGGAVWHSGKTVYELGG